MTQKLFGWSLQHRVSNSTVSSIPQYFWGIENSVSRPCSSRPTTVYHSADPHRLTHTHTHGLGDEHRRWKQRGKQRNWCCFKSQSRSCSFLYTQPTDTEGMALQLLLLLYTAAMLQLLPLLLLLLLPCRQLLPLHQPSEQKGQAW